MTYPPQGGYQPDPYGQQYPQTPFGGQQPPAGYGQQPPAGYGQPADPYGPPQPSDPYSQPPPWPGQAPQSPPGYGQPPGYPPPPDNFLPGGAPEPPKKSPVGWIIGGVLAVVLIVGAVGGVLFFVPFGDSDNGTDSTSSDSSSSEESGQPDHTPTDTVDEYYLALEGHNMDGVMDTMCQAQVDATTEENMYGTYTEEEFWKIVDNSTYTVGTETQKDDENAEVEVEQVFFDGEQNQEALLTAELVVEDNAWKICDWKEPQQTS